MQRTNIYVDDEQARILTEASRARGISRAALIRRLIEDGLGAEASNVDADIEAIRESFGVLRDLELPIRGEDGRSRHLDRVGRR